MKNYENVINGENIHDTTPFERRDNPSVRTLPSQLREYTQGKMQKQRVIRVS